MKFSDFPVLLLSESVIYNTITKEHMSSSIIEQLMAWESDHSVFSKRRCEFKSLWSVNQRIKIVFWRQKENTFQGKIHIFHYSQ
jgi:hypothetical protein